MVNLHPDKRKKNKLRNSSHVESSLTKHHYSDSKTVIRREEQVTLSVNQGVPMAFRRHVPLKTVFPGNVMETP